ncbi:hypothetical protein L7F22_030344 [Adiantum nelumboides]|nr:hypothetical protein [Adiantum nelumboides]
MSKTLQEEERLIDFSTLDLQNDVASPDATWAIEFLTRKLQELKLEPKEHLPFVVFCEIGAMVIVTRNLLYHPHICCNPYEEKEQYTDGSFHLYSVSYKAARADLTEILFCTVSGVYFAERLNLLLSHNWTYLTQYPYFDHQGIFMSAVWSAPLLFIACIILVNSVVTLSAITMRWNGAEKKYRKALPAHKEE